MYNAGGKRVNNKQTLMQKRSRYKQQIFSQDTQETPCTREGEGEK
jgi:hypothetical protein